MKIGVIGGTGHIGRFLIPILLRNGHEVTVVHSGRRGNPSGQFREKVSFLPAVYKRNDQAFLKTLAGLEAEVVVDILGSDLPGVYEAVKGSCRHLIACGSLWMFGPPRVIPTPPETQNPCEMAIYALRYREIQEVKTRAEKNDIAFTAVMPSNICGPGKIPLDSVGGRDIECHRAMKAGKPVILPEHCETLIGPCDASDIAQVFALAVENRDAAAGEIFNAGPTCALSAVEFIHAYGKIHGTEIPIDYVSWPKYLTEIVPDAGANYHFRAHMCPDISKTQTRLGYKPEFTPEQSMERAVRWMRDEGLL